MAKKRDAEPQEPDKHRDVSGEAPASNFLRTPVENRQSARLTLGRTRFQGARSAFPKREEPRSNFASTYRWFAAARENSSPIDFARIDRGAVVLPASGSVFSAGNGVARRLPRLAGVEFARVTFCAARRSRQGGRRPLPCISGRNRLLKPPSRQFFRENRLFHPSRTGVVPPFHPRKAGKRRSPDPLLFCPWRVRSVRSAIGPATMLFESASPLPDNPMP